MRDPLFIQFFAKRIGKSISTFTKGDWKRAAITAAEFYEASLPRPRKRGRKKKYDPNRTLAALLGTVYPLAKGPVGRPVKSYGRERVSIGEIANMIDQLLDQAPRTRMAAARDVLRSIGHPPAYAESVLRSVRDFRKKST
jgi:hypothetical protein